MTTFLDRALPLLDRGFSLIPCEPRGKKPLLGVTHASTDPTIIEAWAKRWPEANVAIVADANFCILDIDDGNAFMWIATLPETFSVRSSEGKVHCYLRKNGFEVRNQNFHPVGSLRADNFYCIGPESVHPDGHLYKVIKDVPVAELSLGLYQQLKERADSIKRERENRFKNSPDDVIVRGGEGRHEFLTSRGAYLPNGKKDEEQLFAELWAINEKHCSPPVDEAWVRRFVNDFLLADDFEPMKETAIPVIGPRVMNEPLTGEPVKFDPWEYALGSLEGSESSGWFPRGRFALVGGASGGMKTTLLVQALVSARDGEAFLGHPPGRLAFIIFFADRGKWDVIETLRRMKMEGRVPHECINQLGMKEALAKITEAAKTQQYAVIVIDGADLLVEDNNSGLHVKQFATGLQKIAEHYGIAMVLTTGSGKYSTKAVKDGAERRSLVKGSEVWSRTGGSIFTLASKDDGTGDSRELVVQHRNAATERYILKLKAGRLERFVATDIPNEEDNLMRAIAWIGQREKFFAEEFKDDFPQLSGSVRKQILNTLTTLKMIRKVGTKPLRYATLVPSSNLGTVSAVSPKDVWGQNVPESCAT